MNANHAMALSIFIGGVTGSVVASIADLVTVDAILMIAGMVLVAGLLFIYKTGR